jgi:hypothetical protein
MMSFNNVHHVSLFGLCGALFACGPSVEELEQQKLQEAWIQSQKEMAAPSDDKDEPAEMIEMADIPMSVMLDYDNLSPLMQGYFGDARSVSKLTDALKRDRNPISSPAIVRVRWIDLELNRGKGEIAVVYDRMVESFEQLQPVANALLEYRNYVGGAFDMRLLSFGMFIEGQGIAGCGFPLLNKSGLSYGLVSPCLSMGDDKICAKEDGTIPDNMKKAIDRCFVP